VDAEGHYMGEVYLMSIIDILQAYNTRKRFERLWHVTKGMRVASVKSCVPPEDYARRFVEYIEKAIVPGPAGGGDEGGSRGGGGDGPMPAGAAGAAGVAGGENGGRMTEKAKSSRMVGDHEIAIDRDVEAAALFTPDDVNALRANTSPVFSSKNELRTRTMF
jgi:hypothetical protein